MHTAVCIQMPYSFSRELVGGAATKSPTDTPENVKQLQ